MSTLKRLAMGLAVVIVLLALAAGVVAGQLPAYGAGALLHPSRHALTRSLPPACEEKTFAGAGVALRAWQCRAIEPRKGTIIYLHGVADNRGSASGVVDRFAARGFDVIAYDSRSHGASEGDYCTYGFFEKQDLHHVIDALNVQDVILIGHSLGAAVALQEAAADSRIRAVVAASTFSDLRTVATERAPPFFSARTIAAAFQRAEQDGRFVVDDVSPVLAAGRISAPVLVIHGEADRDTPPSHSQRVFKALAGPKQLIMVPGAGHNDVLRPEIWVQIEQWIERLPPRHP